MGGIRIEGAIEGAFEGTTEGVKQKYKDLLLTIIYDERLRTNDYAEITGFSIGTMERYISGLRKTGIIEFIGKAPQTGGYFLTESFKKKLKK